MADTVTSEQVIVKLTADNKNLKRKLSESERSVNRSMETMTSAVKGIVAALSVREIVKYSDSWKNINSQLKLVTNSTKQLTQTTNALFKISQDSRNAIEGTVDLYTKLARSTKSLGTSEEELLQVTETINKAITISGVSAQSANAALIQLSQGFASGTLRGEELNSVMEQTPRLAQAIAEGMGVTIGELRALGQEGKITSEAVINALKGQADTINTEFTQVNKTVSQSFTQLGNSVTRIIGIFDSASGTNNLLADTISSISQEIDGASESVKSWGAFTSAVVERTSLLFKALFETLKFGFATMFTGAEIGFNSFIKLALNDLVNLGIRFNQISGALGFDKIDLTGINTQLNLTIENGRVLTEELTQGANQVAGAWNNFLGFDISAKYQENINSMVTSTQSLNTTIKETAKEMSLFEQQDFMDKLAAKSKAYSTQVKDDLTGIQVVAQSVGQLLENRLTDSFRKMMDGAFDFKEFMSTLLKDIAAEMIRIFVIKQAIEGTLGAGGLNILPSANGNVFNGGSQVKAYANGGVVNSPTFFPMNGNKTGLMGEAGPEAIVPLTRTPGGDLGVKASPVNVTVINNAGANVSTQDDGEGNIQIVLDAVANSITRGVGPIGQSMESRYGLTKA